MDNVAVFYDRKKLLKGLPIQALSGVVGIWLVYDYFTRDEGGWLAFLLFMLGCFNIMVFYWFAVVTLKKYRKTDEALLITPDGVTDNTLPAGVGFIPFGNIKGVKEGSEWGKKFVVVLLHNPDEYMSTGRPFQQKVKEKYLKQYGSPFVIAGNEFTRTPKEMAQVIEAFMNQNSIDKP